MSRLTNVKLWALALCLMWISAVAVLIADHPDLARAAH
jgi:hypothetical protein